MSKMDNPKLNSFLTFTSKTKDTSFKGLKVPFTRLIKEYESTYKVVSEKVLTFSKDLLY